MGEDIKGKTQEDIAILNIYAPNKKALKFIKKKKATLLQLKLHIDPHTLILGDFNTLFLQ